MKHFCSLELNCLPTLIPMHNRKMMKQSKINLKVVFKLIVVLMEIKQLMVILRRRRQKSETTLWPIYFMMMKLMPKLSHWISNRRKSFMLFFMLFMLGERLSKRFILKTWKRNEKKKKKENKRNAPLHLFVTGCCGCGKSHLIKTIYHSMAKLFLYHCGNPDKVRVLLLAPSGVVPSTLIVLLYIFVWIFHSMANCFPEWQKLDIT